MGKVTVIGSGSWGTALSIVLADNGHDVRIWGKNKTIINEINTRHTNSKYLSDVTLPETIIGFEDLKEAMEGIEVVLLAVPTKAIRETVVHLNQIKQEPLTVIHASKGIEPDTLMRISEMIEGEMLQEKLKGIVVLSGPSHAEEVCLRHPTTVTAASFNIKEAEKVQGLFMNSYFRVYTHTDVIGVEIGGALKNIIALGAGISDGLGYGANAKAALITRGLAEITKLGCAMGANPLTFSGLSGVGDLIVTCTSVHSRNWRAGNLLGKGYKLSNVLDNMGMIVEGVSTTKAAYYLSKKFNVEMPITNALHGILFNSENADEAVEVLMKRIGRREAPFANLF
ncbi:glycerol 3-phosphate dehydrogenase (NAD(P)+) [Cytobacillus firmus]|uniref:Glycerol-3-phosphate dehydrogenase [NAD(P)+] n=2 Tax=Cytobacillus TaxID=2675230 RepID=A0A366JSH0_CYTFI|nr:MULTISPECIES: NAD(P)H-dependent glycerol-3-phosphate dehydrogenase [Cytobacillus]RBP91546.1 glycerol 3-phosphate dehydrogenase (NAD(P)+) [Cytobacillus firmus]TDX41746.1 glycerol 3-phosphate dehydrogenase (NAD(P)+) [Cytobacillus oceanisediminis]